VNFVLFTGQAPTVGTHLVFEKCARVYVKILSCKITCMQLNSTFAQLNLRFFLFGGLKCKCDKYLQYFYNVKKIFLKYSTALTCIMCYLFLSQVLEGLRRAKNSTC